MDKKQLIDYIISRIQEDFYYEGMTPFNSETADGIINLLNDIKKEISEK